MKHIKAISDELSAAAQVTQEDLQQASETGFQSVLNLRAADEVGALPDEAQQAAATGLHYAHVPLSSSEPDAVSVAEAIEQIDRLPKPILVHCGAGMRAGAIALIATAIRDGLTVEQIKEKVAQLGLDPAQPHLQQFIAEQVAQQPHSKD